MENELKIDDSGKIVQYARQKFLKEGFYKTSMDEMARELSMSKKTIYKYFPSKDALVEAVLTNIMATVNEQMNSLIYSERTAIEKIFGMLEILGQISLNSTDRWLSDMKLHAPHLWTRVDEFRAKRMNTNLSVIVEQGQKEGIFEQKPIEIVIQVFIAAIRGVVSPDFLLHNNFSFRETIIMTFEILVRGILTEKGRGVFQELKKNFQK